MIFVASVINHPLPQVSVITGDAGTGLTTPVTYNQIKNSFGTQIYNVESLYINSDNIQQLTGVIEYQRFDATGSQNYQIITPTVDPYQPAKALNIKLFDLDSDKKSFTNNDEPNYSKLFILNGNSSFQTTILGNTYLNSTFSASRITNQFGKNVATFDQFEKLFRQPWFYEEYGSNEKDILQTNYTILNRTFKNFVNKKKKKKDNTSYYFFTFIVVTLGIGYLIKNRKDVK